MFTATIQGQTLTFLAQSSLFSPEGLDRGTAAMLSCVSFTEHDKVLDLGCGYGAVGCLAARLIGEENVVMADLDPDAVAAAAENAKRNGVGGVRVVESDGLRDVPGTGYTLILSNPPYHTDFSVAKHFIEKGFNRLALGGKMVMVTKRRDWYQKKLIAIFGGVKVAQVDGYFVFTAEKRSLQYAKKPK